MCIRDSCSGPWHGGLGQLETTQGMPWACPGPTKATGMGQQVVAQRAGRHPMTCEPNTGRTG
eukprot:6335468-Alexandrium_andersonii.AAC.1